MGVTRIVSSRARLSEMVLAAIIAGTAQARPPTRETEDLPVSPKCLKNLSDRYPSRAIYPECSKKAVKANKMAIWGTKIKIPANPERRPSTSKLVYQAAGRVSEMKEMTEVKAPSIKSMGYVAQL